MTTKPKTRKASAAKADSLKPATLTAAQERAWRPHRPVVLTMTQRDEINDIINLVQAFENAIQGSGADQHDMNALCVLTRTIEGRIQVLKEEFDAFAASEEAAGSSSSESTRWSVFAIAP